MSKRAPLVFGCLWLVFGLGQAYFAMENFERGSAAGSPWYHVAFAGAYAFLALVNFSRYFKLRAEDAAPSARSARR